MIDRTVEESIETVIDIISTNRDRIRCYKCREYNHFIRDCPTSREEKQLEQFQQMLNLGIQQIC